MTIQSALMLIETFDNGWTFSGCETCNKYDNKIGRCSGTCAEMRAVKKIKEAYLDVIDEMAKLHKQSGKNIIRGNRAYKINGE